MLMFDKFIMRLIFRFFSLTFAQCGKVREILNIQYSTDDFDLKFFLLTLFVCISLFVLVF